MMVNKSIIDLCKENAERIKNQMSNGIWFYRYETGDPEAPLVISGSCMILNVAYNEFPNEYDITFMDIDTGKVMTKSRSQVIMTMNNDKEDKKNKIFLDNSISNMQKLKKFFLLEETEIQKRDPILYLIIHDLLVEYEGKIH